MRERSKKVSSVMKKIGLSIGVVFVFMVTFVIVAMLLQPVTRLRSQPNSVPELEKTILIPTGQAGSGSENYVWVDAQPGDFIQITLKNELNSNNLIFAGLYRIEKVDPEYGFIDTIHDMDGERGFNIGVLTHTLRYGNAHIDVITKDEPEYLATQEKFLESGKTK